MDFLTELLNIFEEIEKNEESNLPISCLQKTNKQTNSVNIERVIFNKPATIVLWSDGTKTIAKCNKNDSFNKETGLAICISKKWMGNKVFHKVFNHWCEEDSPFATIESNSDEIAFEKTPAKKTIKSKKGNK